MSKEICCSKGNHSYETRVLQLLNSISLGSSIVPPGAATESTLSRVLTSLQNGKEFESTVVKEAMPDGTSRVLREVLKWNSTTNTFDPPEYYLPDGSLATVTGVLSYLDSSDLLATISLDIKSLVSLFSPDGNNSIGYDVYDDSTGTISGIYRSLTITNVGDSDGTLDGKLFRSGQTVSFSEASISNTLTISLPYDSSGTIYAVNYIENIV